MSAKIVLLCEYLQTATFMRRFLKRRGWTPRDIREEIAPPGRGSGEQWVRERYPDELIAMRARGNTILAVGTDADLMSIGERISSLDKEAESRGVAKRMDKEPVIMVIPKRNIETWFAYLRGEEVNETESYRRYRVESECRENVEALDKMCKSKLLKEPFPPSLQAACVEFAARIPKTGS